MSAIVYLCKKGDTFKLTAQYKINGVAQDVTNIGIRCNIKTKRGEVVLTPSVVKDTTTYTLSLTPAQTKLIELGDYYGDIEYTFVDGTVQTVPNDSATEPFFILRMIVKETTNA